jgi:hypothetical protein
MSRENSVRAHLLCAEYLVAIERQDLDAMEKLWSLTEQYPGLEDAFHELHEGLLEEQNKASRADIEQVVHETLPSATLMGSQKGISVAEVMLELAKNHGFENDPGLRDILSKLTSSQNLLPSDLGYTQLSSWAKEHFGSGTSRLWQAFQQAALKVRLRQDASTHYSLAARQAPPTQGK